jgi:delta24-sterol reductase
MADTGGLRKRPTHHASKTTSTSTSNAATSANADAASKEGLLSRFCDLEYMITHHRWFFVVFFLLPLSVLYDAVYLIRNTVIFFMINFTAKTHEAKVKKISDELKQWVKQGCPQRLCTARPGWQAMSLRSGKYKKTFKNIDINLYSILDIDEKQLLCRVEPMVTMGQLTHFLIPRGWTVPVLPELDDLTVGGLVAGVGIETSSHKYGLFQHICAAFEIILPDGNVVECTATNEHSDLFYAVPWSHGTLGFIASVTLRIIPCKPYVDLVYIPFNGATGKKDAIKRFKEESISARFDFVECLAYSPTEYVLMLGNMTAITNLAPINPIGLWYKEWFFTYVKSKLSVSNRSFRDLIPIRHYYHRHSKSLFWEIQDIVPFGNHPLFRVLCGWMMPPKPSLLKITQTEALRKLYELHHVVQDLLVPIDSLSESLDVFDREIYVYPLWLCPFKIPNNGGDRGQAGHRGFIKPLEQGNSLEKESIFVDIGAYGNPVVKTFKAKETCRTLEEFVRAHHGYQMMYADSYMTK